MVLMDLPERPLVKPWMKKAMCGLLVGLAMLARYTPAQHLHLIYCQALTDIIHMQP